MRARFVATLLVLVTAGLLVAAADLAPAKSSSAPTLAVRSSSYGRILFSGQKRALYGFTRDPRGKSTCYGACAAAWPPYIVAGAIRAGAGTRRSLYGTTTRRDGRRQLTYAGKPLYFYRHDPVGQVLCQNVREYGGVWLVVGPSGSLVR
jgi:predicted lipoprotein with Yx(FWY)xxD motif